MKKRWVFISVFTAVLLLTMVPAGEARGVETASEARSVAGVVTSASAGFPGTIGGELGDDFKLSSMGPAGDPLYDAYSPAVAYNSTDNQYLVVWYGIDDVLGKLEIWGQIVDASNGTQLGADIKISNMGSPAYDARDPDVAYNSAENEYLVVWEGDSYTDGEYEIRGRRVDAATGALFPGSMQVSSMGSPGDPDYDAYDPAVAYNSAENQYLVVWSGDDDEAPLLDDEYEIWGRRLDADLGWLDADNRRLSGMGGLGDRDFGAYEPDVAYNSVDNEYMVVWFGDDYGYDRVDDEYEIFGQRLNASGGKMGFGGFRISTMGPSKDPDYGAFAPKIAYNSINNEYMVVWDGEGLFPNVYDIFGQRLAYNGIQVGEDDLQLSGAGNGPNGAYNARNPAVAYDPYNNEYLVVWNDDELGMYEQEIWGQRVNAATGAQIDDDTRLSEMGPDGTPAYGAMEPAVTYSSVSNNQYLIVWYGDDSTSGEDEIWGQRFFGDSRAFLPLVLRGD